jgi:glycosyltransferase involved in cell wall biosynthesis
MASVDVVIPVYNEEQQLAQSVVKLRKYLAQNLTHGLSLRHIITRCNK